MLSPPLPAPTPPATVRTRQQTRSSDATWSEDTVQPSGPGLGHDSITSVSSGHSEDADGKEVEGMLRGCSISQEIHSPSGSRPATLPSASAEPEPMSIDEDESVVPVEGRLSSPLSDAPGDEMVVDLSSPPPSLVLAGKAAPRALTRESASSTQETLQGLNEGPVRTASFYGYRDAKDRPKAPTSTRSSGADETTDQLEEPAEPEVPTGQASSVMVLRIQRHTKCAYLRPGLLSSPLIHLVPHTSVQSPFSANTCS